MKFLIQPKNSLFVGVPENKVHLCQWIFSAPKNSPILKSIIDLSVKRIRAAKTFTGLHFVHHYTGPGVFTQGIENWLQDNYYSVFESKENYSNYRNQTMFVYDRKFHKKEVKHLFTGNKDGGWTKNRKDYLIRKE